MIVVGINGLAGHGKDTLADMLIDLMKENGELAGKYSLATPIKTMGNYLFDMTDEEMNTFEGKLRPSRNAYGKTNRKALQLLGTECFRDVFDESMWIDFANRHMDQAMTLGTKIVFVPDVRFENEAQWAVERGVLLRVIMPNDEKGGIVESNHSSEAGFSTPVDMTISNDGTKEELQEKAQEVYKYIMDVSRYVEVESFNAKLAALKHVRESTT